MIRRQACKVLEGESIQSRGNRMVKALYGQCGSKVQNDVTEEVRGQIMNFVNNNKIVLYPKGYGKPLGSFKQQSNMIGFIFKNISLIAWWSVDCQDQAWKQGDQLEMAQKRDVEQCHQQRQLYFQGYILKMEPIGFEDKLNESIEENREIKNEFLVKDLCNQIYVDDIYQDEKAGGKSDWKRTWVSSVRWCSKSLKMVVVEAKEQCIGHQKNRFLCLGVSLII